MVTQVKPQAQYEVLREDVDDLNEAINKVVEAMPKIQTLVYVQLFANMFFMFYFLKLLP